MHGKNTKVTWYKYMAQQNVAEDNEVMENIQIINNRGCLGNHWKMKRKAQRTMDKR